MGTVLGRVGDMPQGAPAAFAATLDEIDDVEGHVGQPKARLLPALTARTH
ncbi:hypothetical protein [Isoptericola sp. b408]|nr:hypothetical protein [Isoptericola sp. b408]MDO8151850.1 hypothetical protein [Isoptericola sp. b408]